MCLVLIEFYFEVRHWFHNILFVRYVNCNGHNLLAIDLGNTEDISKDIKIREPLPEFFVEWNTRRDPRILDQLEMIPNEAEDERTLQASLSNYHPGLPI